MTGLVCAERTYIQPAKSEYVTAEYVVVIHPDRGNKFIEFGGSELKYHFAHDSTSNGHDQDWELTKALMHSNACIARCSSLGTDNWRGVWVGYLT